MKSEKWHKSEVILLTVAAFLVAVFSWQAAVGVLVAVWFYYLDQRFGREP